MRGVVDVVDRRRQEEAAGHAPKLPVAVQRAKSRRRSASTRRARPPPRPRPAGGWRRPTCGLRSRPASLARPRTRSAYGAWPSRRGRRLAPATTSTCSPRGGVAEAALAGLGESPAPGLLEQLRELAADRDLRRLRRPAARSPAWRRAAAAPRRRRSDTARRRSRRGARRVGSPSRQEALEPPARGPEPGDHEGRHRRRGPGTAVTRWPAAIAAAIEPLARIGDGRRAGVAHERDAARRASSCSSTSGDALALVVRVQREQAPRP